ncbi:hypothetical protein HK414_16135 [Ramlibacter terrae]|uniref:Uncharacterized protein n=1 Tax=Ramlibacter terrae TaxID=2732511 RepID=A0ABX6P3H6_9BURK|nr:hypothetical protein HK414_16135 [Ramlibacter terrae]
MLQTGSTETIEAAPAVDVVVDFSADATDLTVPTGSDPGQNSPSRWTARAAT